jgi:hypothetical protein
VFSKKCSNTTIFVFVKTHLYPLSLLTVLVLGAFVPYRPSFKKCLLELYKSVPSRKLTTLTIHVERSCWGHNSPAHIQFVDAQITQHWVKCMFCVKVFFYITLVVIVCPFTDWASDVICASSGLFPRIVQKVSTVTIGPFENIDLTSVLIVETLKLVYLLTSALFSYSWHSAHYTVLAQHIWTLHKGQKTISYICCIFDPV